jgi:hypothetical protein
MGMKNARKYNNDVRAYTPRSGATGRRGTKANRARRQNRFRVAPDWLGKRFAEASEGTPAREEEHEIGEKTKSPFNFFCGGSPKNRGGDRGDRESFRVPRRL